MKPDKSKTKSNSKIPNENSYKKIIDAYEPNVDSFVSILESDESLNETLSSMTMALHKTSMKNPFDPETARRLRTLVNAVFFFGSMFDFPLTSESPDVSSEIDDAESVSDSDLPCCLCDCSSCVCCDD